MYGKGSKMFKAGWLKQVTKKSVEKGRRYKIIGMVKLCEVEK